MLSFGPICTVLVRLYAGCFLAPTLQLLRLRLRSGCWGQYAYMHRSAPICTVLLLYALFYSYMHLPTPVCGHARTSQTPCIHGRLQRRHLEQVECIYRETNGAYRGTEAAYRTMAIWALWPDEAREMRTLAAQLCHERVASVGPLQWRATCPEHTKDCSDQREQRVHIGTKGCI